MAKLAVLIFIDESGKPGLREEDPFVLAALIVHESVFFDLENEVSAIVQSILGPYGLPGVELHAKDLIQGKGDFRSVPVTARVNVYRSVIEAVARYADEGFVKGIIIETYKDFVTRPSEEQARKCIAREAYHLMLERVAWALYDHHTEGIALLVIDESELDNHIRDVVEEEILKGKYTSRVPTSKRILLDPVFARSQHYRSLQVTDLIAYTARRAATMRRRAPTNTDTYFSIRDTLETIKKRILRKSPQGTLYGYGYKTWNIVSC